MSRFFIFIFTYILICFPFQAQKLISSTGGVIINSNSGSVSYSIGEPIISTISGGSNGDVTQGYQQISSSTKMNKIEVDKKYPCLTSSGATVVFTDLSSGNPTSWLWDFGDGNTSTQQNPTHTYTNAGTYNTLSINNNHQTQKQE